MQNKEDMAPIIVFASTEEPKLIDEALRRSGRFDYELWLGAEHQKTMFLSNPERVQHLSSLLSKFPLHSSLSSKFDKFLGLLWNF